MAWWDNAYPGGPMVAVRGFPRPLAPDAEPGHKPSVDESDVEAYKRTVSWAPAGQSPARMGEHE
jgi:hypothetical protein